MKTQTKTNATDNPRSYDCSAASDGVHASGISEHRSPGDHLQCHPGSDLCHHAWSCRRSCGGRRFRPHQFSAMYRCGRNQCMGAVLFEINPFFAFIQRFVPRFLDGLLLGYIFRAVRKSGNVYAACLVTGFCSAFLNTVFFMTALVVLFGNTDYVQGLMGGKNVIVFICTFVGINAVCEMISSTILTGAIGAALSKARLIPAPQNKKALE